LKIYCFSGRISHFIGCSYGQSCGYQADDAGDVPVLGKIKKTYVSGRKGAAVKHSIGIGVSTVQFIEAKTLSSVAFPRICNEVPFNMMVPAIGAFSVITAGTSVSLALSFLQAAKNKEREIK